MSLPTLSPGYAFVVDHIGGPYVVINATTYVIVRRRTGALTPLGTPFRFNSSGLSVQIIQPAEA